MQIDRESLEDAARRGLITPAQADALWAAWSARPRPEAGAPPSLAAAAPHAAGLALAGALGAALLTAWAEVGSLTGLALSLGVLAALLAALPAARRRRPAAGTAVVVALVALAPLATHAAFHAAGSMDHGAPPADLGAWVASHDAACLLAAALALAAALWRDGSPPLSAGAALVAWLAAMSAAPLLFGPSPAWDQRALLSALVGLLALAVGFTLDRRTRADHAGWLYLAGLALVGGSLGSLRAEGWTTLALLAFTCAELVVLGLLLARRSFAVAGGIGLTALAGRIADRLLVEAAATAVVLLAVAGLVGGAALYARHEATFRPRALARLPELARRLLPPA